MRSARRPRQSACTGAYNSLLSSGLNGSSRSIFATHGIRCRLALTYLCPSVWPCSHATLSARYESSACGACIAATEQRDRRLQCWHKGLVIWPAWHRLSRGCSCSPRYQRVVLPSIAGTYASTRPDKGSLRKDEVSPALAMLRACDRDCGATLTARPPGTAVDAKPYGRPRAAAWSSAPPIGGRLCRWVIPLPAFPLSGQDPPSWPVRIEGHSALE